MNKYVHTNFKYLFTATSIFLLTFNTTAKKATLKRVVDAHYYKLTTGGNEPIEIDVNTNLCYWKDE